MSSRGIVRVSFSCFLLCLLVADSVVTSAPSVFYHFKNNLSYSFQAAKLGNSQASLLMYEQSNNPAWLKRAAEQGSAEAAFAWYQLLPENRQVWLSFSVTNKYPDAVLQQLALFRAEQRWQQADELIKSISSFDQETWSDRHKDKWVELTEAVNLALSPSKIADSLAVNISRLEDTRDGLLVNAQPSNCRMTIQPIAASKGASENLNSYKKAIDKYGLSELKICMKPVIHEPKLTSVCQQDRIGRLGCDLSKLSNLPTLQPELLGFSHLLILMEQGDANTRGGIMFLDKQDSPLVFIHELAHFLGLVDEYQIGPLQQAELCKTDRLERLGLNLLITHNSISQQQAQSLIGKSLYPARTCLGSNVKAYKYFPHGSFMEYLEKPISEEYLTLIKQNLDWGKVVPASMNFAHEFDAYPKLKNRFLQHAASLGYEAAINQYAGELIKKGKYLLALQWLEQGAHLGSANSQLLLGHAYIEGAWLKQDLSESAFWYKKAAEQKDGYGLYFYGKCLEMGWGCTQSLELAQDYYHQAAQLGNPLALKRLNREQSFP